MLLRQRLKRLSIAIILPKRHFRFEARPCNYDIVRSLPLEQSPSWSILVWRTLSGAGGCLQAMAHGSLKRHNRLGCFARDVCILGLDLERISTDAAIADAMSHFRWRRHGLQHARPVKKFFLPRSK
ncbi:hypothetical protein VTN31DRAFT_5869 [Thermomyces dupontii]|uniref:uncharacterized protein n=1 Tax=Talaromyces thermophilus TaxID=28565 RepID=UPI003742F0AC